jgi:hypothetical protein
VRQGRAFQLRCEGWTFEAIARKLEISTSAAWKAYGRELASVREMVDPCDVREHVTVSLHRLDRALTVASAILEDAGQPSDLRLRAVDRVVRIEERRARLLGLDAPRRAQLRLGTVESPAELTPEQIEQELKAFAMPAANTVAAGPEAVQPPAGA